MFRLIVILLYIIIHCESVKLNTAETNDFLKSNPIRKAEFASFIEKLLPVGYKDHFVVEQPFAPTILDTPKRLPIKVQGSRRLSEELETLNDIQKSGTSANSLSMRQAHKMMQNLAIYEIADAAVFQVGTISSFYNDFLRGIRPSKEDELEEKHLVKMYAESTRNVTASQIELHKALLRMYYTYLHSGNKNDDVLVNLPRNLSLKYSKDRLVRFSKVQESFLAQWTSEHAPDLHTRYSQTRWSTTANINKANSLQEQLQSTLKHLLKESRDDMVFALKPFEHVSGFNMPVLDNIDLELDREVSAGDEFLDADFIRHRPTYYANPVQIIKNSPQISKLMHSTVRNVVHSARKILSSSPESILHGVLSAISPAPSQCSSGSLSSSATTSDNSYLTEARDMSRICRLSGGAHEDSICSSASSCASSGASFRPLHMHELQSLSVQLNPSISEQQGFDSKTSRSSQRFRWPLSPKKKPIKSHPIPFPVPEESSDEEFEMPPRSPQTPHITDAQLEFSSIVIYELKPGAWFQKNGDIRYLASQKDADYVSRYFGDKSRTTRQSESKKAEPLLTFVNSKGVPTPKSTVRTSVAPSAVPGPLHVRWCYAVVGYDMKFAYSPQSRSLLNNNLPTPFDEVDMALNSPMSPTRYASSRGAFSESSKVHMEAATPLLLGRIYC